MYEYKERRIEPVSGFHQNNPRHPETGVIVVPKFLSTQEVKVKGYNPELTNGIVLTFDNQKQISFLDYFLNFGFNKETLTSASTCHLRINIILSKQIFGGARLFLILITMESKPIKNLTKLSMPSRMGNNNNSKVLHSARINQ